MTTSTEAASGLDPFDPRRRSSGGQSLRCSDYARATSLSPIATSGSYDGYLLVEIPLPWPRDVGDTAEGAALGPLIGPLRYRMQAVAAAEPKADPRERRVILHARPPGEAGFGGYRRFESRVGDSLTGTVAALITAAAGRSASEFDSPAVDVLVCTHGTRDSCCGRRGASLAADLAAAGFRAGENLWRTSHMGGHRFAPTFMVLPQGTVWGFADVGLVTRVVEQAGDFADAAGQYRGCPGLDGPQVQALEAQVLRRVGWRSACCASPRLVRRDNGAVELAGRWPDGHLDRSGRPRAHPARAGLHGAASAAGKSETEWVSPRCIAASAAR